MCLPTGHTFLLQVMRKSDLIRKNMVQSVKNERNILAMANNPFVVHTLALRLRCCFMRPAACHCRQYWARALRVSTQELHTSRSAPAVSECL